MRKEILQLPRVKAPKVTTRDFACSSYTDHNGNTQIDFSCDPYGSQGNIDVNKGIFKRIFEFFFG